MTILQDILPLLRGWKFDIHAPGVLGIIPAGGYIETFNSASIKKPCKGYVLGVSSCANNPLATLEMIHFGPNRQERSITGSPFAMNALGLQYPNGSGFWYGTYTVGPPANYCGFYHPDSRIGFWDEEIRIRILNPTATPIMVSYYSHTIVIIVDEEEWTKSLRELLGAKK